jgi:1,2-dihydroxy-3-keto-5-methylthiopentene dioxygenase
VFKQRPHNTLSSRKTPTEHLKHEGLLVRQRRGTSPRTCTTTPPPTHITNPPPKGDQRLPHDSGRSVDPTYLSNLGVIYQHVTSDDEVNALAKERNYKNRDEITVSPEKMGAIYEEKVKSFFHEHLHEDEEIRYILDGAGFFDVRSEGDEWVRIWLEKGDLIVLPAGIYHRFTTDDKNYIRAMRLFKEEPKWTPLNRSEETDANTYRKEYLTARQSLAA